MAKTRYDVEFRSSISKSINCVCNACFDTDWVIRVSLPDTHYDPGRQALLKDGLIFQNGIDEDGLLYVPLRDVPRSIRSAKAMGSIKITHGKWASNGIPESILSACSVCGFPCGASTFKYCPQCGAMMDK